ncbi:MAG: hypothetical protein L0H22_05830, partial [Brevibacterium aurantiacum]|nr:hypothetical protein [Brevibacterium aurantiacum]
MNPTPTPNSDYAAETNYPSNSGYSSPTGGQGYLEANQGYTTGAQPPQSYRARAEEDPGKVLGIISLVATRSPFLGFSFLGRVVGII